MEKREFYFINAFGEVDFMKDCTSDTFRRMTAIGNHFSSQVEAVNALQAIKKVLNDLRSN